MKRQIPILIVIAGLTLAATAYGAATDSDLEGLADRIHADELAFEQARADLDAEMRAYTRPVFRRLMDDLDRAVNSPAEHAAVAEARRVLAAPGPAWSVAKHLHEATRKAGAVGIQALRRAQASVGALID